MKMLLYLVKKDLILTKKYLLLLLIFAIGIPIFLASEIDLSTAGFLEFFLSVFFVQYMLFNTVSMAEDKYKGSALLCATPYTRNALVKAKYLFSLLVFLTSYIVYTLTVLLAPIDMEMLNIFTLGISLLSITVFWGIIIPLQYQFGYQRIKYIAWPLVFMSFFILPAIVKWMQSNNISLQLPLPFPPVIQDLVPIFLALVIGFVSMNVSVHIYARKAL